MPLSESGQHIRNSQETLQQAAYPLGESMQSVDEARQAIADLDLDPATHRPLTATRIVLSGIARAVPEYITHLTNYLQQTGEGQADIPAALPEYLGTAPHQSNETGETLIRKDALASFMTAKSKVSDYLREHGNRPRPKGVSLDEIAVLQGAVDLLQSERSVYGLGLSRYTGVEMSVVDTILKRLQEDGVFETKMGKDGTAGTGRQRHTFVLTDFGKELIALLPEESLSGLVAAKVHVSAILRERGLQPRPRGARLDEIVALHGLTHYTESEGFSGVELSEDLNSDKQTTTAMLRTFEKDGILESEMEQFDPVRNPKEERGARRLFRLTQFGREVLQRLKDIEVPGHTDD